MLESLGVEIRLSRALVRAWLEARSARRGITPPGDHYGGYRVDTRGSTELARLVFLEAGLGIISLDRSIFESRHLIKLTLVH